MKIANIDRENLYLLSDLRDFNDIFMKDVTCDNIKIKKRQGLILSLKDNFWKNQMGSVKQIPPFMDEVFSEERVKKDNKMGGNIPGGNFLGGNFPGGIFQDGGGV